MTDDVALLAEAGRMRGIRRNNPLARLWRQAVTASKEASKARRARVLAHPDLAQRLTEPPLSLSSPERWSGWIPPRILPEDCCSGCYDGSCRGRPHAARVNHSPVRRQLVAIAAEAYAREADDQ